MPDRSDLDEYQTALTQAALFDLSDHGKIELAGKEAASFLHNLCTNEINKLPVGMGCEVFLTTGQAKIVAHGVVDRVQMDGRESLLLDLPPGLNQKVYQHLDRHLISEQLELGDRSVEFGQFHLAGPKAANILKSVVDDLPDLQPLQHAHVIIAGHACRVRRHDPLGLPGFDLIGAKEHAEAFRRTLTAAGAIRGSSEIYEVLRIEAGTPVYGEDIDDTNLPQELRRDDRTISFTKGCYIGQETVARIRTYGHVNRLFVGLKFSQADPVARCAKIFQGDKEVGRVTSSVFSPSLGATIALGYVRKGNETPGKSLEVETGGSRLQAQVVTFPFR